MRLHPGTLLAGFIYLATGVAFLLEALGAWSLRVSDLRYIGPLALVAVGLAVLVGSLTRRPTS
ncbi:MAG: hypothetical protein ACLFWM_03250 [Actinomycetota bacterium]